MEDFEPDLPDEQEPNSNLPKDNYFARRRKFVNLRKRPKKKGFNDLPLSQKYQKLLKRGFMELLSTEVVSLEQLEQYHPDWCTWLDNLYNPTTTRQKNKVIYPEDIPFYSSSLLEDYEEIYLAIASKINVLQKSFKKVTLQWKPKEYTYGELLQSSSGRKLIEEITQKGTFYYTLPKEYTFFEFQIVAKEIISNVEINFQKARLRLLPKNMFYFGFLNKNRPHFVSYYSIEEVSKGLKIKALDRKRLLENNLKERGLVGCFIEGTMVWDIDDIHNNKDVLIFSPDGLFKSIILKKEKQ